MRVIFVIFLFILFASCNQKNKAPEVTKVDMQLKRFEQQFFTMDTANLLDGFQKLGSAYPQFFPFFMNRILNIPLRMENGQIEPQAAFAFKQIIAGYKPVFDSIQLKYKTLDDTKAAIEKGFSYVKHYYPAYQVPELISYIATFDAPGIVLTPQYLGIGLHQFAGKNFSIYQDPQLVEVYPVYISRRFDKEFIPVSAMKAVADDIYPDSSMGRPLIEQMIEKGKQWYLAAHFLHGTHDSLITGFTKKQLEWVQSNEGNVWGFLNSNHDVYTIDPAVIQDYIGEAPFTRGMPEGYAPGNIGQWVGWKIVRQFAEKNNKLSLNEVLATPAATIFQESRYKPK
jgi:hypothetical protein